MCKCKCCCDEINPIEEFLKQQGINKEKDIYKNERETRLEYVRRNIPIILDLVSKFHKYAKEIPKTEVEAKELEELRNNLAVQIVNYTR